MSSSWQQVAGLDPTKPNVARVYDYWLGGSHHFVADRELGRRIETVDPWIRALAKANRAFLGRVVRFLATDCGIRQFLDIGSGIPATGNVHEVSQRTAPDSRVIYVDHDPVVVALSRELLARNDRADVIQADLRQPEDILSHPVGHKLIDSDEPTAVLFVSILHFLTDAEDPYGIVARFREAVAPGSYLVVSHGTNEDNPQLVAAARDIYTARAADGQARSREEIIAFFGGWDLLEPGLVHVPLWRPGGPEDVPDHPERFWMLAGVARKPENPT
jgi:hypothetical protein